MVTHGDNQASAYHSCLLVFCFFFMSLPEQVDGQTQDERSTSGLQENYSSDGNHFHVSLPTTLAINSVVSKVQPDSTPGSQSYG